MLYALCCVLGSCVCVSCVTPSTSVWLCVRMCTHVCAACMCICVYMGVYAYMFVYTCVYVYVIVCVSVVQPQSYLWKTRIDIRSGPDMLDDSEIWMSSCSTGLMVIKTQISIIGCPKVTGGQAIEKQSFKL